MLLKGAKQVRFTDWILLLSLLWTGGFYEYVSCGLSVALSLWLLIRLARKKQLRVRRDLLTSAVVAVSFGYGFTCLWAVDPGMGFIGFMKFLPLLLYLLCLQQEEGRAPDILPYFGAALAALSAIGMQIAPVSSLFSVAGRLAGTFQYPNTFAVFLLVCELLLLKKTGKKLWDYGILAILLAGFLYTGSRTALLVGILANAALLLTMTDRKRRLIALGVMGGICLVGLLLALPRGSVLHRYLTISLTESTFVGRILYWVDALPLLLKYPFGMGYLGYYYTQQSIQTGVYAVTYIHNDFLQLILDVGFVPAGLFIAALVGWFRKKTVPAADKIILGAVCLHSFFDFDLQFVGMFFLVLLLLSGEKTDKVMTVKPRLPLKLSLGAAALVGVYLCAALTLSYTGNFRLADKLYPYNTQNKLEILETETSLEEANRLADSILKQNTRFYAPYAIKTRYCYTQGDFTGVIENARAALARNPFDHLAYEECCKLLLSGIALYQNAGSAQSAEVCRQEVLALYQQFLSNGDRLSRLGKMIDDQPVLELSPELVASIGELE